MILLSEDGKGFVVIKSWDDVLERPGYTKQVDPNQIKLKQIIGRYHIDPKQPCGISSCGTAHNKGYLILCEGGLETNIGNKCGKRIFGVDFQGLERTFTKDTNAQRFRQNIGTFKNRLIGLQREIDFIINGEKQASWCVDNMHWYVTKGFEQATLDALNDRVKRNDNEIRRERQLSSREIEIARETGINATHEVKVIERINGLSAIRGYKKLKNLIEIVFKEERRVFLELDETTVNYDDLKKWNRWARSCFIT